MGIEIISETTYIYIYIIYIYECIYLITSTNLCRLLSKESTELDFALACFVLDSGWIVRLFLLLYVPHFFLCAVFGCAVRFIARFASIVSIACSRHEGYVQENDFLNEATSCSWQ